MTATSFTAATLLMFGAVFMAGCAASRTASADTSPQSTITPTSPAVAVEQTWSLTSLGGAAIQVPAERGRPSLVFDAKTQRVSGFGGVNRFSGTYRLGPAALIFGQLMATKMAGSPEMNDLETRYPRALGLVRSWRLEGAQLELRSASGEVLAVLSVAK